MEETSIVVMDHLVHPALLGHKRKDENKRETAVQKTYAAVETHRKADKEKEDEKHLKLSEAKIA